MNDFILYNTYIRLYTSYYFNTTKHVERKVLNRITQRALSVLWWAVHVMSKSGIIISPCISKWNTNQILCFIYNDIIEIQLVVHYMSVSCIDVSSQISRWKKIL